MVFSPTGFLRFRYETLQILLRRFREFDFSKSITRFQTRIWNPGDNVSDSKEYQIENRLWPDLTQFIFPTVMAKAEKRPRERLGSSSYFLGCFGFFRKIYSDKPMFAKEDGGDKKMKKRNKKQISRGFLYSKFRLKIGEIEPSPIEDDEDEPRRWPFHSPVWVLVYIGSCAVTTAVLSDLKKRVKFIPNYYSQIQNRLIIKCIHIGYRRLLVIDQYFILLELLLIHSWWYWKQLFWSQIWGIRQRRLLNDGRESELSNILISMKQQNTGLSPTTPTSSSHLIKEVMPKAFWTLSSKLIANNKCVKEGHNRSHLLARKAFNSRVTLHSFIEIVSISYICVQGLFCFYSVFCKLL